MMRQRTRDRMEYAMRMLSLGLGSKIICVKLGITEKTLRLWESHKDVLEREAELLRRPAGEASESIAPTVSPPATNPATKPPSFYPDPD